MPVGVNSRRFLATLAQQSRWNFDLDRFRTPIACDETFNPCQSRVDHCDLRALGAADGARIIQSRNSTPFSNIQVPACRLRCWPPFPAWHTPTKAASASGSPASLEASRPRRSSRVGRWRHIYYHTSVSAGADVARAREFSLGRVPGNLTVNANLNLNVNATGNLGFVIPTYVFATPVLGGQASVSLVAAYGVVGTSLAGTLSGVVTGPFGNSVPFARSDSISDTTWGFGDLAPQFNLRWNAGVHNYMAYVTGDIPVGAYQSTACRIWASDTARSTAAAAIPISIRRPATNSPACSASPTISRILRRNIRAASTCTSTGVHRSSCRSRSWLASWAMSTRSSAATAVQATVSAASSPRWLASVPRSDSFFRSATCRAISISRLTASSLQKTGHRLECLGHLLHLAAGARRASDNKTHRQKILGSGGCGVSVI